MENFEHYDGTPIKEGDTTNYARVKPFGANIEQRRIFNQWIIEDTFRRLKQKK